MTATNAAVGTTGDGHSDECWCCGQRHAARRMVHLGNHPEVALCLRCAHFVHKEAGGIEDAGRGGPLVVARTALRQLRREAVRRDWHRSPLIGGPLRWIGKRMP